MPYWNEPGLTWDHPLARYDDPRTFAEILATSHPMYDVVLDANSNLSTIAFIARVRELIAGARSRACYASLAAYLDDLEDKVDALEQKEGLVTTAESAAAAATDARDTARATAAAPLQNLATKLGELAAAPEDITLANARTKEGPTKRPLPGTPTGLELKGGDEDGELSGQCNGQPGIIDFLDIEYTTTDPNLPDTVWHRLDSSKRTFFVLNGLPSGQKVWVRVRAVNSTGKSGWSDPACKRVP